MIVYVAQALTATGRCARCEPCGEQEGNAAENDAAQRALRALRVVFDDKCCHLFVFLV